MNAHAAGASQKVALVTGAARGIGLAVARRFLREGWSVGLLDIDAPELEKAMTAIGQPERTLALECDAAFGAQVDTAVKRLEARFGRIDALVNNAGIAVFKPRRPCCARAAAAW